MVYMPKSRQSSPVLTERWDWGAMHDRATLSNNFSISVAQRMKGCCQNWYRVFLISSMKVISKPHGCGLLTMSLSKRTRVTCSFTPSSLASLNKNSITHEK
mmetsp:Transcript_5693/g.11991  ORF Transcript_5693/g.11991 Transcript_5693/m.11991 type:complete len:101 (+) Transcript_5693:427-729(+)